MRHAKRQLPLTEASAVIPGHLVFRVQPRPTSFLIFWLLCSLPSLQCLPTPWASPSLPAGLHQTLYFREARSDYPQVFLMQSEDCSSF